MDKETYDRGLNMRRKVLGEEYVDRALKSADDFNRDFQRIVTQYCWGELGRRHAEPARALDPQSRHDRRARQNGGIPDPYSRGASQRPYYERNPRRTHSDRGLLRCPGRGGLLPHGEGGFGRGQEDVKARPGGLGMGPKSLSYVGFHRHRFIKRLVIFFPLLS